ncbi:TolC family protein [Archangium sp.]|uniref:TolC family protein n=1 Tax=Archangium sp. TaxID=1872627 RepID=UPI002D26C563|nr:TolC family protein [Archangium sp.]HYO52989.1 TolC family protein [Archangium sp.]
MNRREPQRVMGVGLVLAAALAGAQIAPAPTPAPSVPTPGEVKRPPLTLEQLVQRAREQDARVEEAEAELRRLQALLRQARWAWFPKFETLVGAGGPLPEARNDGLGGPPTTEASLEGDLKFGRLGVTAFIQSNAVLPLYTFGKLKALEKAAEQGPVIGRALKARAQDEAGFQAAQAFFGYQLARSGLVQLEETAKRLEDAAKRLQEMLDEKSEQVSKMDLYKVGFFRKQLDARRVQAEQGRQFALAAIRLLAGVPPGEPVEVAEVELEPEGEVKSPALEEALALAERKRPELTGIAAGLIAREQEVFIRERSFYPDLGLAGFLSLRYTTSATPQRNPFAYDPYNEREVGVGLVARYTFDFPVKQAELDQARAELDKLKAQQRLLRAAIRLEVTKAHGELVAALERAQTLTQAERDARRWATAAMAAFDLGTTGTRDLVESFTALAQSSADRAQSWHDFQVAQAELARVTGTASRER